MEGRERPEEAVFVLEDVLSRPPVLLVRFVVEEVFFFAELRAVPSLRAERPEEARVSCRDEGRARLVASCLAAGRDPDFEEADARVRDDRARVPDGVESFWLDVEEPLRRPPSPPDERAEEPEEADLLLRDLDGGGLRWVGMVAK